MLFQRVQIATEKALQDGTALFTMRTWSEQAFQILSDGQKQLKEATPHKGIQAPWSDNQSFELQLEAN